ncbi:hypothetical protein FCL40_10975 [Ferrimonas sediminicola]|uniref:Phosphate ABC transporter substrate-binding protein n=1 Tax=Ferrimonas sediminicola TaxID=2569538 RepID=A0A4U1BD62_9GAMM|nr:hypothetical protein [Ferrimonas sediminicola]TKB48672.1 hypothetical protein FCL40_10975 [Ferrimonas sediminicola]
MTHCGATGAHWLLLWLAMLVAWPARAGYVLITLNDSMPAISESKARMLYLGKLKSLDSFGRVELVDFPEGSVHKQAFYQSFLNKSLPQINSRWAQLAFSGKGKPPESLVEASEQAVLAWLAHHPRGIAYVPRSMVPRGARILLDIEQGVDR